MNRSRISASRQRLDLFLEIVGLVDERLDPLQLTVVRIDEPGKESQAWVVKYTVEPLGTRSTGVRPKISRVRRPQTPSNATTSVSCRMPPRGVIRRIDYRRGGVADTRRSGECSPACHPMTNPPVSCPSAEPWATFSRRVPRPGVIRQNLRTTCAARTAGPTGRRPARTRGFRSRRTRPHRSDQRHLVVDDVLATRARAVNRLRRLEEDAAPDLSVGVVAVDLDSPSTEIVGTTIEHEVNRPFQVDAAIHRLDPRVIQSRSRIAARLREGARSRC